MDNKTRQVAEKTTQAVKESASEVMESAAVVIEQTKETIVESVKEVAEVVKASVVTEEQKKSQTIEKEPTEEIWEAPSLFEIVYTVFWGLLGYSVKRN